MKLSNIFDRGRNLKYFGNDITPKCSYCQNGMRSKNGTMILCENVGMVKLDYSCPKFVYSPLKRVPVKQLNKPGNFEEGLNSEIKK